MPPIVTDPPWDQTRSADLATRVETACRLFETRRLSLWQAARQAGVDRVVMEAELLRRGIPLYEVTEEQLNAELAAMDRLGIPG
jgi:predicted HTH domain antitoxin